MQALIPLKPLPLGFILGFTLASPHGGPYSSKALALRLYLGFASCGPLILVKSLPLASRHGALIPVKPLPLAVILASLCVGHYSDKTLALGLYLGPTSCEPLFW